MIEDLIKKLTAATEANTEATIINNDLLRDHIKIREACAEDPIAEDPIAEDPIAEVPDSVKTEAPEVDEAAERKAKAAKKRAAKKKAEADAQEAIDKLAAKEKDEPAEEEPAEDDGVKKVTGDDIRAYVRGVRAEMEPAEKAEHKKGFKALLQDGDYKTINDIPAEDLAEFLDDTKGLIG